MTPDYKDAGQVIVFIICPAFFIGFGLDKKYPYGVYIISYPGSLKLDIKNKCTDPDG